MDKKIAVVTGARRGIGYGIALELLKEGFFVVLSATRPAEECVELLEDLRYKGFQEQCDYVKCNIQFADDRDNLINTVIERYKKIDLLVNNAGISVKQRGDLLDVTEQSMDELLDVNLKGTFFLSQRCAKEMIRRREVAEDAGYLPKIINISSVSATTSSTQRGEYCISKAGLSMVSLLFADRLAEYCIPVFEVRPGIILTDMTSVVRDKYEAMIQQGLTPTKRFGQPEDVGKCVAAISKGYFDFSTGQVFHVDGGFSIRRL